MGEVKVTTLSNGLRVAVDEMPEVESATLGIWVACGTRHESAELNGMAHMLEHMAFKGTRTVGTKDYRKEKPVLDELHRVGTLLDQRQRELAKKGAAATKEDRAAVESLQIGRAHV